MFESDETRAGGGDSPRRGLDVQGWFLRLRAEVRRRADHGQAIGQIEEELIAPSALSDDAKSSLWRYGRAAKRRASAPRIATPSPDAPREPEPGAHSPSPGKDPERTRPQPPRAGGGAHIDAVERLDNALNEQARVTGQTSSAESGPGDPRSEVEAAAASERVAARKAWLDYIERGY